MEVKVKETYMKNNTLAALASSCFLLGGCCALHCNCKTCPKKEAKEAPAPVLVAAPKADAEPAAEAPVVEETAEETPKKVGWEMWALAGGVVALGVVLAFTSKKKTTKV